MIILSLIVMIIITILTIIMMITINNNTNDELIMMKMTAKANYYCYIAMWTILMTRISNNKHFEILLQAKKNDNSTAYD